MRMSPVSTNDLVGSLADSLAAAGQPVSQVVIDGEVHRYNPGAQYSSKKPCWYVAHQLPSGHISANFGDWRSGLNQQWNSWEESATGPFDIEAINKELEQAKQAAQKKRAEARNKAAREAQELWNKINESGESHYLRSKNVDGFGIRYGADRYGKFIAVPMRSAAGDLRGLQRIYDQPVKSGSNKLFGAGTWKEGSYHLIGECSDNTPIFVAEGYATAASIHMATRHPVVVCFDAWNAIKVIRSIREIYPAHDLVLAADNDQWTQAGNTGAKIAETAASLKNCFAVLPDFSGLDTSIKPTDFNDLHRVAGLDAVKTQLESYKTGVPSKTWKNKLTYTRQGQLHCSVANISKILQFDSAWRGVVGWDQFSLKLMKLRKPPFDVAETGEWADRDDTKTAVWLSDHYGFQPTTSVVAEAVTVAAEQNTFHPVKDYLSALKWDGKQRVNRWLITYMGAAATPYNELVSECWMIGAIARIMKPGCKMDNVMIFEGGQGKGKSTALGIIGGEWFTDTPFELGSKDGFLAMRGKWIIELAELDSFNRAESTRAKHFFAASVDTYREPYGRRTVDVPRQCIFAGSTNSDEYLKDDTGNRRYWPVTIGDINHSKLREDRDQLLAEAVDMYKRGYEWWFPANLDFVTEEQEQRYVSDAWEIQIIEYLDDKKKQHNPGSPIPFCASVGEILSNALGIKPGDWERKHQMRVSSILKRLKMIRKQITNHRGLREWVYTPKFNE